MKNQHKNLSTILATKFKGFCLKIVLTIISSTCLSTIANASTALKDNSVSLSRSFDNFDRINVTVNVPEYQLQGQYRFLKIYDDSGNVLFLGAISATEIFTIPVQPLKIATSLTIEIFTETAIDNTVVLTTSINP